MRGVDIKKRARNRPLYGQFQSVGSRVPSGLQLIDWKWMGGGGGGVGVWT